MLLSIALLLIVILLCSAALGLLLAAERTIVALRLSKLRELLSRESKRAAYLKKLRNRPNDFFKLVSRSSIIILSAFTIALCFFVIKYIIPQLKAKMPIDKMGLAEPVALVLLFALVSFMLAILIELIVKLIAARKSESFALWVSAPLWAVMVILKPFMFLVNRIIKVLLSLFGVTSKKASDEAIGESEIQMIIKEGYLDGALNRYEKKILYSLLEFSDTTVRRAMTPRTEIVAFDINDPVEAILKKVTVEKFSRFPVYEESLDNIKGIIHSRDLLYVFTYRELFVLRDIIRDPYFVPDSKPIPELLREMQLSKTHMAIVLDEFGGTGGIITMEDVLEEIVGDIQDEYDQEVSKIVFIDDKTARVISSMPIDEFADEYDVEVDEGEFDTVAGMLVTKIGRIPSRGETLNFDGYSLEVEEKDGHRIKYLIARKFDRK